MANITAGGNIDVGGDMNVTEITGNNNKVAIQKREEKAALLLSELEEILDGRNAALFEMVQNTINNGLDAMRKNKAPSKSVIHSLLDAVSDTIKETAPVIAKLIALF